MSLRKPNAKADRPAKAGERMLDMENERKAAVPGTVGAVVRHDGFRHRKLCGNCRWWKPHRRGQCHAPIPFWVDTRQPVPEHVTAKEWLADMCGSYEPNGKDHA